MAKREPVSGFDIETGADSDLGPAGIISHYPEIRQSRFFTELYTRLVVGRDANVVITASSETGVGKSTLAVTLALLVDQHGWTADKAAIGSAAQYDRLYDTVAPGSAVILDEAEEAVDSRRGMTSESVSLAQSFAAKRYKQVFSILTAPTKGWIDKRLGSDSADFWIQAEETELGRVKGEGPVYRLRTNEHYEQDYTKKTETVTWPNISEHPAFEEMDDAKTARYDNSGDQAQYFGADEVAERVQEAKEQARSEYRRQIASELNEVDALTQGDIGDVFGISSSRVSQIVNTDG